MDRANIHVLIFELRRAIGHACIETVARRGYRFAVEVIERQRPPNQPGEPAITTLYGLTPEGLQKLIKDAVTGAVGSPREGIDDLSNRLKVTQDAALEMLRIIGQADVPPERLPEKLAEVAEQYKSAMDRLAALDPEDPITGDLVERAEAAMKVGQFEEADRLVSEAEHAELAAAHRALQSVQQARATADQRLLRAADHRGVRGDIAVTGLRYLDAAQHFQEAADLVPAGYPDNKGKFLLAQADALKRHGD
jgi:hypothetical protein